MATSELFTQIYRTLPPEEQKTLVEEQLAPLLDTLSYKQRDRILGAVKQLQARRDGIPNLDLIGKKREMKILLMMLLKDDKVLFTRDRSNREEILQEIVHSISSWLSKIWLMAYEFKVNYDQAHDCLLYALKSMPSIEESPALGECKCLLYNIYVNVTLKDKQGHTVKYFSFTGPRKLEEPCLWIWRDLFLSMLAHDRHSKTRVQEMLMDIEEVLGWPGLELLLHGGKRRDKYDSSIDEEEEESSDAEEAILRSYEKNNLNDEDPGDDDDDDDDESELCFCCLRVKYWSDEINEQRVTLRAIVKARLLDIFREAQDPCLFNAITSISRDPAFETTRQMLDIVSDAAKYSADAFKAALTIYTDLCLPHKILNFLEVYYHHIRPSDTPILVRAAACLTVAPHRSKALKFMERELFDTVQHIWAHVRSAFFHFIEDGNRMDLTEILKLQVGSPGRAGRIERWVDRALTTSSEPMHPMALAAMMMGFPGGPSISSLDETDLVALIDLNNPDPDLDSLRDEFKPLLKSRFDAWHMYAQNVGRECAPIIHKVYTKIIELMPFFRAPDIVVEMTNRLSDKPSKLYIQEVMLHVSTFCKNHRKMLTQSSARSKKTAQKSTMNSGKPQPATAINGSGAPPSTPASAAAAPFSANPSSGTGPATSNASPVAGVSDANSPPAPGSNTQTPATGPTFHFFNTSHSGPFIIGHPLPIPMPPPPTNNQNTPFPNAGNTGPGPNPSAPPECNHQ